MKLSFFLLFCCSFLSSVMSSEKEVAVVEEALPRLLQPETVEEEVLIANCKGLVLVGNPRELLSSHDLDEVRGLKIVGVIIPGGKEKLEQDLIPLFLGKSLTASSIEAIRFALISISLVFKPSPLGGTVFSA